MAAADPIIASLAAQHGELAGSPRRDWPSGSS